MSCEIKPIAKLSDLNRVQELFGLVREEDWLDSVYYSISPTLEIIAFGHGTKIILLNQKWNDEQQQNIFSITWTGELENPNDVVTSVICLPVIAHSSHTQNLPEWTTIAIGLSSGLVLFYTDFGMKIFSQQWHYETVLSIKAQSGKGLQEEIYISYETCICIIDGLNLFPILKNMKQQFLKMSNHAKQDLLATQEVYTVPCRKWGLDSKNPVNDLAVVGPQLPTTFDHLLNASLSGGFYAKYRSAPAQKSLVLGAGSKPYLGFHYAKEGFVQPVLADVARTVASKLKSALPSWLRSQPQESDTTLPMTPVKSMVCPFGLCDQQRSAMNIYLAPGNQLAAVTDSLGRVILVDCMRGIAVRVWKGYRKAQCSFLEVTEKTTKHSNPISDRRRALFMIIFAPKRSCLEIWPIQRGAKIAAFYASKNGQLIYNTHNLMGALPNARVKYSSSQNSCFFFDPSDNTIKTIQVPFYCAISDSNSKIAKDLHLMRRIKLCLKNENEPEQTKFNEIEIMCSNLQTIDIRTICLEMLVTNSRITPTILKLAITAIQNQLKQEENDDEDETEMIMKEESEHLTEKSESDNPKYQRSQLLILCENYFKLTDFYCYILNVDKENIENISNSSAEKLSISAIELNNIQRLLDLLWMGQKKTPETPKVTFKENAKIQNNIFISYLSTFNVQNEDLILLHEKKIDSFDTIGSIIFSKFLEKGKSLDKFVVNASKSGILCEDFMKLLLHYWLNKPFVYSKGEELIMDMSRFTGILEHLCLLAGNEVEYDYYSISLWWQNVRELLLESSCALRGLLAAIMCRNQAVKCCQKENATDDISADVDMNFEEYSQEACQWTLLIGKLDDVAVLGAILGVSLQVKEPVLPILKYEKPTISLKSIVSGGKGVVTELVVKWIASTGMDPELLLKHTNETEQSGSNMEKVYQNYSPRSSELISLNKISTKKSDQENGKINDKSIITDPILNNLYLLKEHFPFSLKAGVLLTHLTWEFMSWWSNNLPNINYLEAAIKYLETIEKENYALKHGICCMIWNAHLKLPLEATRKLIDKVGHLPREKLCLQDIGLSDSLVLPFLENCLVFFDHFISSIDHEKINLSYEETLQDGQLPLSLLALQQNLAILELLNFHKELIMVLHLISFFNIKQTKPKYLFSELANQTFFCQINKGLPYELPQADLILNNTRNNFLCKLITSSIDLIRYDLENVYLTEHITWIEKIENLAKIWDLSLVGLKQHQIIELYANGWDSYAEDLLSKLSNIDEIGSKLIYVVACRLNAYTKENTKSWSLIETISPMLSGYLEKIPVPENICTPNDVNKLLKLAGITFEYLSKTNSKDLKIAALLYNACSLIEEYVTNP